MKNIFTIFAYIATLSCELFVEGNEDFTPFLSGSTAASINQFPFQVAIVISEGSSEDVCNGALIKHKWVLTTANCIRDGKDHKIILGMINITTKQWESGKISNSVITIHPNYNATTKENNIALIYVADMPVPDGISIATIEIPSGNVNLEGREVRISGYGKTSASGSIGVRTLNYFDTRITTTTSCSEIYAHTKSSLCIETTASKLICAGDLGSPMTSEVSLKRVLLGMGSLTTNACVTDSKALFENVLYHRNWIMEVSNGTNVSLGLSTAAVLIVMILRNFV
ncbi:brachyurin-like [Chironomus tepperi]|uniref:brachyurin-like n=1 Tax=Chironomus tepperi TaxID=113505 RepID=UPI00391FA5B2